MKLFLGPTLKDVFKTCDVWKIAAIAPCGMPFFRKKTMNDWFLFSQKQYHDEKCSEGKTKQTTELFLTILFVKKNNETDSILSKHVAFSLG